MNCPISLSYAAIIYSLRSMINREHLSLSVTSSSPSIKTQQVIVISPAADIPMPLNQGVLDPITNVVPAGSFLNPSGEVAIAGSTISSQRLVDVILQAFKAAACSQGCASSTGFGESDCFLSHLICD